MSLYQKLLDIQKSVDALIKDGKNNSDKYDFASDENVLDRFRPLMDEAGLLLIPKVDGVTLHEGQTKSGTVRYLTEMGFNMVWHDVESGEELVCPWYAQGVDLAGEKGVGKAATYAEKYFLLKFFHVPTKKDDPDNDKRTQSGEKAQKGTQAAKENTEYYRKAISQILDELCGKDLFDEEKRQMALITWTANDTRGFKGYKTLEEVPDALLPQLYGAKAKVQYEKRTGKPFKYEPEAE